MKNTKDAFNTNQIRPGIQVNGATGNGGSQPPRNRMVAMAHMVAMATYSPSMNIMYGVEPYSTMKPATNSDFASTRSNGGQFGSGRAGMKKTMTMGNSGSQYQLSSENQGMPSEVAMPRSPCALTMSDRFKEPTQR